MPVKKHQEIKVIKGGLEAQLTLVPYFTETGERVVPPLSEIELWIREQGIVSALDYKAIEFAIMKAGEGLKAEVIASRGIDPTPGKDGYLEYLIDFESGIIPSIINTGKIDLRTSLIRTVQVAEPLALIHAPLLGIPGIDVFGKFILAPLGHIHNPKIGANIERSKNDPSLLVAKVSGHVCLVEKVLEVQEFYLVPGDVDYSSGNISFEKSVLVKGDVKSGFSVAAGGDLEIAGLVEDCHIMATGNVYIKGGFTGQGKGLLKTNADATVGYIRNQHVQTKKNILILKESINGNLQSCQSIKVNGLLAGGSTQAYNSIECLVSGTESGTPTQLEVGFDFFIADELIQIRSQMEKMGRYSKKLGDALKQIQDLEKLNRTLEPWTIELLFEMESSRNKVEAKSKLLSARAAILERKISNFENASITIHRRVNLGTSLKIGKDIFLVNLSMNGPKTFYSKNGVIEVR